MVELDDLEGLFQSRWYHDFEVMRAPGRQLQRDLCLSQVALSVFIPTNLMV